MKVLSQDQVEQFIECGYTRLSEAFPVRQALEAQDFLWERVAGRGVLRDDRSTWADPMVHIKEAYSEPVFERCATTRLADAVEDLVGAGRWSGREKTGHWGWWPVNFALGADRPWDVPSGGWHWDGQHFRHFVDSPDQGLLLLCMFSETGPHGGGTLVAEGSHRIVARFLSQFPEGLEHRDALGQCPRQHPWLNDLLGLIEGATASDLPGSRIERFMERVTTDENGFRLRVVETTASPGDVMLCHPFLYHAASQNHSGIPRFMCNRTTPLKERMKLERANGDYSAVEISIRHAINV